MQIRTHGITGLVLSIIIVIVWLPNQFQTSGIQEEWRYRAPFDGGVTTYNDIGSDSSEEQFFTRPFYGGMNGLSYLISPDSFIGHHIILIALLLSKGFMMYLLCNAIFPSYPLWAYFSALLLILYPSDPGIVSFRTFHHHLTIVAIISSAYFLIRYYKSSQRRYIIAIWVSQIVAALSAETGYPIFFITPLIILLWEKRLSRQFITTTILFYIVPAITFAYSIYLILIVQTSWQRTAIASYTIREYLRNIYNIYEHNFITAWRDIIDYFLTQATSSDLFVFVASLLVTLIGSVFLTRHQEDISLSRPTLKRLGWALILGGIAVLAGYAMFLSSRTHVLTNFRVYLLSSVGVVIVITTLIYALYIALSNNISRYLVLLLFSILMGLSTVFANKTHNEYLEISEQQESLARQITSAVPALNQPAYIIIKTPSNEVNKRLPVGEIQKPVLFTPMLQFIYNDYEQVKGGVICFRDYLTCDFTAEGMDIRASNFLNIDLPIPYDQMIIFNITKTGELSLIESNEELSGYGPLDLIDNTAPPTRRIQTLYGAE